jgi:hypothetical protein
MTIHQSGKPVRVRFRLTIMMLSQQNSCTWQEYSSSAVLIEWLCSVAGLVSTPKAGANNQAGYEGIAPASVYA